MDVSPKSGETLIVYHIHGQFVGWPRHNSVQTSRQPRSLNLTHSISLPERGDLPREALDYGGLSHTNKSSSTETADKKGTENSRGYKSFPMLCVWSENSPSTSPQLNKEPSHRRLQNLFIPDSEVNEDEEDEDSEGDNLHKYYEGSSLQLQGNATHCNMNTFSQANENKEQGRELDTCGESKGTPVLMECDEQDWGDVEDFSRQTLEEPGSWAPTENLIESFTQNQTDYITDSSCNSSDGVLVNFSAIYNKTNNAVPATPLNLDSPVHGSGSMLQDSSNPLPSWSSHSSDPNCNIYPSNSEGFPSMDISDLTMCLQSQARLAGSSQNYYKLVTCDLSSQSSPSPPWSSLTSFSETQSHGSCSPPSEYFLFGHAVRDEKKNPKVDQSEHQGDEGRNKDQSKGTNERMAHIKTCQSASKEHGSCNYIKTPQSQSWTGSQKCSVLSKLGALQNSCPCHSDTNISSPLSMNHATCFAEIVRCKKGKGESSMKKSIEDPSGSHFIHNLSSIQKQDDSEMAAESMSADSSNQSNPEGACASSPEVVRYTKAQRPTFLPIQPFVLQAPSGKQQSKTLGSLLNQYMSHKYTNAGPSKAPCKSKVHPHHVQPSPLGSSSNIHLEAATSSDSCSTCTSSPILPHNRPHCTQPSTMLGLIHQDLMNRNPHMSPNTRPRNPQSPEQTERSPKACSSQSQKQSWSGKQSSHNSLLEQVPLVQIQTPPVILEETTGPLDASHPLHQSSSPAITSVTSLTSISSLISLPGTGQKSLRHLEACTNEEPKNNAHNIFGPMRSPCVMRERQHSDSFSMTDRPPDEFCLSQEAPSDVLSIDILHKRSMLKAVSLAVDLIIANFNSRQDPEEKIRLGNSSLCTTISILVLKKLYPAIQNILQDGLKAYKFDLIIGKRRNNLWNIVEATTQPGSSARMPDSLVSVVKKCSQLSSRMRLSVFIIDLLNLRALEFWIHHVYTCVDVVTEHYHHWGFLALAQGPIYGQLFQELLLLLQPLSLVPFDLHLPPEPQSMEKQKYRAPLPHRLLAQSAQFLQMSSIQTNSRSSKGPSDVSETDASWQNQTPTSECGTKTKEDEAHEMENIEMPQYLTSRLEDKHFSELRWARLFGSGVGTLVGPQRAQKSISGSLRSRRPSEWLKLGASKVDLLAQSVWTGKWPEAHPNGNHDRDTEK
ncbi:iporin isoform X1 [Pimephales promelas]|uniref:iporin isoform X1 n=1 Tax=Pimephales promelas TaxID=90988 RepID=UPI0019559F18|nr:iporin isoform X1 [Pimephales promelas]KAG1970768.1 iporin [Pimephales promelas]KAG1970770.1 iporin [Pimephales promelas]KAG1970771.1 iporin [Pimephales promelas]